MITAFHFQLREAVDVLDAVFGFDAGERPYRSPRQNPML